MTGGIFFRHVLRDIGVATGAVALVLLSVLVIYQFAFVLGRAADGQVPAGLVAHLVGLSLRGNLPVILPFAVLLGTVLGLGRLHHDSELAAAHACGIGTRTLYAAAGVVIAGAALLAAWLLFVDGPVAAREVVQLRVEALRTAATRGLAPGQFRSLGSGATLHFRALDPDGTLRDVFVERDAAAGRRLVVLASSARYSIAPDSRAWLIDLGPGTSYEGVPGRGDWRVTQFRRQQIRIPTPAATLPGKPRVDVLGSRELIGASDPRRQGELHWRIGWVLNVVVLGLLAVPLARLQPRQGRHARVPWAVLLFALYAGLLSAGRTLLERGDTPAALGLWWVHAAAIGLGLGLLATPRLGAAISRRRARPASGAHPASR